MSRTWTTYAEKRLEIRKRFLSKEICEAVLDSADKQICLSDIKSRPERRIHQQKTAGGHGLYRVIVNPSTREVVNSYYTTKVQKYWGRNVAPESSQVRHSHLSLHK